MARRPKPLAPHHAARARELHRSHHQWQIEQIEARLAAERGRRARCRYLDLALAALLLAVAVGLAWADAVLAFD